MVCRLSLALAVGLSGVTFSIRRAAFASRLSTEDVEAMLTTSSHTGNARKLAWHKCSGLNRSNFYVAISDRSIGAFFLRRRKIVLRVSTFPWRSTSVYPSQCSITVSIIVPILLTNEPLSH